MILTESRQNICMLLAAPRLKENFFLFSFGGGGGVGFFGGSSDIRCVFSGSLDVFCGVWGHFWPGCLCFAVSVLCHHGALEVALPCPHCPHHFEVPHRPHGDSHRVSIALEMAIVTALGTPLGHLHCHRDARPAFPLSCGTPCRAGSVPLSPP